MEKYKINTKKKNQNSRLIFFRVVMQANTHLIISTKVKQNERKKKCIQKRKSNKIGLIYIIHRPGHG